MTQGDSAQLSATQHNSAQLSTTQHNSAWLSVTQRDSAWLSVTQRDSAQLSASQHSSAQLSTTTQHLASNVFNILIEVQNQLSISSHTGIFLGQYKHFLRLFWDILEMLFLVGCWFQAFWRPGLDWIRYVGHMIYYGNQANMNWVIYHYMVS